MDFLEKLKEQAFSLEGLPFLEEVYLYGSVLESSPRVVELLLVTSHQLSPKERHEAKKKVRDVFWEVNIPFQIKITDKDKLASQVSRRQGLGRIFDGKTLVLYRK